MIRRNNKRVLYESIMKDVAKTVKRHLNEGNQNLKIIPTNKLKLNKDFTITAFEPYETYECDAYVDIFKIIKKDKAYYQNEFISNNLDKKFLNNFLNYIETSNERLQLIHIKANYNIGYKFEFNLPNIPLFDNFDDNTQNDIYGILEDGIIDFIDNFLSEYGGYFPESEDSDDDWSYSSHRYTNW